MVNLSQMKCGLFLILSYLNLVKVKAVISNYSEGNTNNFFLPKLAPFHAKEDEDALGGVPAHFRQLLRAKFSRTFFEPRCVTRSKPLIQPIYYWPGDTIRLQCKVCKKSEQFNSDIRYWSHLKRKVADKVQNLQYSVRNGDWTLVSELLNEPMAMPKFVGPIKPGQTFPEVQITQQDGYLTIQHSRIENYGLYRCFSKSQQQIVDFVYYLIPRTPYLETSDSSKIHDDCIYDGSNQIVLFDSHHRWRMLPPFLQNSKNNICAGKCNATYMDEEQFKDKYPLEVKGTGFTPSMKKLMNLEIFLKWSNWSDCNEKMQTRMGDCHIRKKNKRLTIKDTHFEQLNEWRYLLSIHKLLEEVNLFQTEGILLFSGVMFDLNARVGEKLGHCQRLHLFEYSKLSDIIHNTMLRMVPMVNVPNSIPPTSAQLTPCIRRIVERNSYVIISHPFIQNRKC